jgi:trimeric autotransporter adhesin
MAWTSFSSPQFATGHVMTQTDLAEITDNLRYLKGTDGAVTIDNKLAVGAASITPTSPLHAVSATTPAATIHDRGAATYYYPGSSAAFGGFTAYKARGSAASPTTVNNGDGLGVLSLGGYDGSNYLATASIYAIANGTVAAGSIPTDMVFTTDAANNTFTERLRITSAGKIGINQSAPTGPLHVKGSIANWVYFEYDGVDGTARTVLATGSASYAQYGFTLVRASDGTVQKNDVSAASLATATIYTAGAGANVVQLIAASGGYTVQRTAGSLTYKVAIFLFTI